MANTELFEERKTRVAKAVALERPDRVPVVLEMAAFAAKVEGMTISKFISSSLIMAEAMINAVEKVGGADGVDYPSTNPLLLSLAWLSRAKLPGVHLPDDVIWQMDEAELMKREDYDRIAAEGWPKFFSSFVQEHFGDDILQKVAAGGQLMPQVLEMWRAKDIPVLRSASVSIPFESFCGGRSYTKFVRDLFQIPDRVQAAMDAALPFMVGQKCEATKQQGLSYIWVGGWRSASAMLSKSLWDRFVFPYFNKVINEVIDAGIHPILHFDSDWTRDLERFKVFPKGKCIFSVDGMTDIFKAKEILGDTMCIMGDVPASLLSLGTPDEVYKYCRKLIDELGQEGFILHPGCDIPMDAKIENVQAMVSAATGK